MARPLEETPVLSKRQWKKFEAQLFHNRNKSATHEEYEEMRKNYESIASVSPANNPKPENEHTDESKHS